jgi:hypothetical protein
LGEFNLSEKKMILKKIKNNKTKENKFLIIKKKKNCQLFKKAMKIK